MLNGENMDNTVHFMLASKGGCGKTFSSSLLAQYFVKIGAKTQGYDTDQENPDFLKYKGLPVKFVDVMEGSTTINQKKFDGFIEEMVTNDGLYVIDNGANSFTPLMGYLIENNVIELLQDSGKKVYIHCVVGGGDNLASTSLGFTELVSNTKDVPIVLWLNEHFGKLEDQNGVNFVQTEFFKQHSDKVCGAIMLHHRNTQTYGEDIKKMTSRRLTVDEVMHSDDFSLMEKQRLRTVAKDVFEQISKVNF